MIGDTTPRKDALLLLIFAAVVLAAPVLFAPIGAGYPDLLQKFAIYGIFALGFNILFGLTGYLSFGHAAFLGVGSYSAVWTFKLFSMNPVPAIFMAVLIGGLFSALIGYISLRRTGIYFSILTLAFAQMSYNLAYSVLTPLTNGETGLQVYTDDPQILLGENHPLGPHFFGIVMQESTKVNVAGWQWTFNNGYYFCAIIAIIAFYLSLRIFRSPFGTMLRAIKTNQTRMNYTGLNPRPYTLAAWIFLTIGIGLGSWWAYYELGWGGFWFWDPVENASFMPWLIAAALLRPERRGNGLDALAKDLLGLELIPTAQLIGKGKKQKSMLEVPLPELAEYAAEDADATWRLYEVLREELADAPDDLRRLIEELEFPLVAVLARMEARGVAVDLELLAETAEKLSTRLDALRAEIQDAAGREFNVDSPAQLGTVLFDDLGMRVVKRTKTGRSTDASVLEALAAETEHPLPALVLEYRELSKLLGTYLAPLPSFVAERDGRLHASFHQVGAATGRLSSSDPNIQNIPVRTETGRLIRRAFVAGGPDRLLLTADYSQVELRMLAHLSKDAEMTRAFEAGLDIHAFVASQVYGVDLSEVTSEQRRVAKTVNFGIVYGQTAFGLAKTLRIPQGDAAAFIEAYKERYVGIDRFLAQCIAQAEEHGWVATLLGRRRPVTEVRSRNRNLRALGERLAINTVVQGSAADLIKLAMRNLDARLREDDAPDAQMIIQVHDELVFDVDERDADSALALVRSEMTGAMTLDVPIVVDAAVGPNWVESKD